MLQSIYQNHDRNNKKVGVCEINKFYEECLKQHIMKNDENATEWK